MCAGGCLMCVLVLAIGAISEKLGTGMTVFLIVLLLGISGFIRLKMEEKQEQKEKERISGIQQFLNTKNFIVAKGLYFHFKEKCNCFFIDDSHKQFGLLMCYDGYISNPMWNCYEYKDLIDFDVSKSGISILQGNGSNALAGAVIAGTTGAVIGSVTGDKKIDKECSSLVINVRVNNINHPLITIDCLDGKTYMTDSNEYRKTLATVNEIVAVLTYIQANKDAIPQIVESNNNVMDETNAQAQKVEKMQKVCSRCRQKIDDDSVYCGNCGAKYIEGVPEK